MARKVSPKVATTSAPVSGADDLAILNPDVTVSVAGRDVTVREYGFIAGQRVRARAKPLTDALRKQIESGSALMEEILDVLAEHRDLVRELVAESAEVELEWIDGLDDDDGQLLLFTWWGVCGPFFVRMIARRISQAMQLQAALAGRTSTPGSSLPATAIPNASGATPSVN